MLYCRNAESPQWRRGPAIKPVLCNACGTRYRRTGQLNARGVTAAAAAAQAAAIAEAKQAAAAAAAANAATAAAAAQAAAEVTFFTVVGSNNNKKPRLSLQDCLLVQSGRC